MRISLPAAIFLFTAAAFGWAEPSGFPLTSTAWINVLGCAVDETLTAFGSEYRELSPDDYGSGVSRLFYYPDGLTIWSDKGRVVQLRLDKNWNGRAGLLRIGSGPEEILELLGDPWIEDESSLYYNLPWNGGPVRLRLIFTDSVLEEIYLFNVR